MRTFEDFPAGMAQTLGPLTVSKDDIVAFAREYDAQPFHVDEIAARDSFIGTLIASGWHSCSLNMRLVADGLLLDSSAMGAPGIEEVKWVKPVRPGDTLRSHMTVLDSRISKSKPSLGLVRFHFDMVNQADEKVLSQTNWVMFATRDAAPFSGESSSVPNAAAKSRPGAASGRGIPPVSANPFFEDLVIGETEELGSTPSRRRTSSALPGSSIRSASMWMRRPRRAACSGRSAPRAGIRRASG